MIQWLHAQPMLIVMRHGEGTHNIEDVYDKNAQLTEKGRQQVTESALKLLEAGFNRENIVKIFVSPMPRTRETAALLVAAGLIDSGKIICEPRIEEPHAGILEGKKIIRCEGKNHWDLPDAEMYGGETISQVRERIKNFYLELSNTPSDGHVLVVSHGTPIRELFSLHLNEKIALNVAEAKVVPLSFKCSEK